MTEDDYDVPDCWCGHPDFKHERIRGEGIYGDIMECTVCDWQYDVWHCVLCDSVLPGGTVGICDGCYNEGQDAEEEP